MLRFRSLTATFFACPEFCARNSTRKFLVSTIAFHGLKGQPRLAPVYFTAGAKQPFSGRSKLFANAGVRAPRVQLPDDRGTLAQRKGARKCVKQLDN